jgi:hypothetical protein
VDVTVKLHGTLRSGKAASGASFALALPDGATAGDLLERLGALAGAGLPAPAARSPALPSCLRLFVGGELVARSDLPLARPGAACGEIVVVVTAPMSGG